MKKIPFGIRFGQCLLWLVRPLIWLIIPYKVVGKQHVKKLKTPHIVCCNHISAYDPVYLLCALKKPICFMGKESLFKTKVGGWILKNLFGVFPVNREKKDSGAIIKSLEVLESGASLGIFPEGTRSKDGKLGAAKSGAVLISAKTETPILPCAIIPSKGFVKFFHKTTVVIGEELSLSDLNLDGQRPDLRFASRTLMAKIGEMIEENKS